MLYQESVRRQEAAQALLYRVLQAGSALRHHIDSGQTEPIETGDQDQPRRDDPAVLVSRAGLYLAAH